MLQKSTEGVPDRAWLGGKGDPLGIVQKKFEHITKWFIHNPESVLENEAYKTFSDF